MDELLYHLKERNHTYADESVHMNYIISSIHIACSVLIKYYSLVHNEPVLCAAVVPHLDMKLKSVCDEWSERLDCIESATSHITTRWETKYCHLPALFPVSTSQPTTIAAIPMPPPPEPSIPQWRGSGSR